MLILCVLNLSLNQRQIVGEFHGLTEGENGEVFTLASDSFGVTRLLTLEMTMLLGKQFFWWRKQDENPLPGKPFKRREIPLTVVDQFSQGRQISKCR